jgi:adenylate kinase
MICDVCGGTVVRRSDDNPEIIKERLRTYHAQTEPLIAYYEKRGELYSVDGNGGFEQTFSPVKGILDGRLGRTVDGGAGS